MAGRELKQPYSVEEAPLQQRVDNSDVSDSEFQPDSEHHLHLPSAIREGVPEPAQYDNPAAEVEADNDEESDETDDGDQSIAEVEAAVMRLVTKTGWYDHRRNLLTTACIHDDEKAAKILLDNFDCDLLGIDQMYHPPSPLPFTIIHNKINLARMIIGAIDTLVELHGDIIYFNEDEEGDYATAEADDRRPYPNLHLACKLGRLEIVNMIFDAERKITGRVESEPTAKLVNTLDFEKKTPLYHALENNHLEIARRCIEEGAFVKNYKPNIDKKKTSLLHLIANNNGSRDTVDLLSEYGADVNYLNCREEGPLYTAAAKDNHEVCKALLDKGAFREKKNCMQFNPLLIAANDGHAKTVQTLLDAGADIFAKNKEGRSALHLAALKPSVETLEVLLKCIEPHDLMDLLDQNGNSPLHIAAEYGNVRALQFLCKKNLDIFAENFKGRTALHLACLNGMESVVKELTESSWQLVSIKDNDGNTPLHLAAKYGNDDATSVLLKSGKANIDARNNLGEYPIHMAARENLISTCELLLEHGAEVDSLDDAEGTPLHWACATGSAQVVSLLVDNDAKVKATDASGYTCLDVAIQKNQKDSVLAVIRSKKWKAALTDVSWDEFHGRWDTPMRKLIRNMPDVAREVLIKCSKRTEKTKKPPERKDKTRRDKDNKKEANKPHLPQNGAKAQQQSGSNIDVVNNDEEDDEVESEEESMKYLEENQEHFTFNYKFIEDFDWVSEKVTKLNEENNGEQTKKKTKRDKHLHQKSRCLNIMIQYNRVDLLSLPLVRSLLRKKWSEYGKTVFWLNLWLYTTFLLLLNVYVLSTLFMAPHNFRNATETKKLTRSDCDKIRSIIEIVGPAVTTGTFAWTAKIGIYILSIFHILKEIVQMAVSIRAYLDNIIENLLEWFIYVSALLLVVDLNDCQKETGIRHAWQWELGAVCVFWSWINLLLFIRKVPIFGLYVVMFTNILQSFLLFFPILLLFITAFATSFHLLLANQIPFRFLLVSVFKVCVMMIGEMEYGNTFDDRIGSTDTADQIWYEVATYMQFAIFLIFMTILVMNLMVGLAVDNIKEVMAQSELQSLVKQTEFLLEVESFKKIFIWAKGDKGKKKEKGIVFKKYRGLEGTIHRYWVLSGTAIIEESDKSKQSEQEKMAEEIRKLSAHNEQSAIENKEIMRKLDSMAREISSFKGAT